MSLNEVVPVAYESWMSDSDAVPGAGAVVISRRDVRGMGFLFACWAEEDSSVAAVELC